MKNWLAAALLSVVAPFVSRRTVRYLALRLSGASKATAKAILAGRSDG